jgi:O-acetylhomoserine/O-acetylserine sulfhydrylase-like pyridoxal-dependent enzyme
VSDFRWKPSSFTRANGSSCRLVDLGIAESLVRVSVGIEQVNHIIADVEQALEK